jgi:hypothetical protein
MYSRSRINFAGLFHLPATLGANANDPQQVLAHLKTMLSCHRVLYRLQLGRKKLNDPATLGTDHMVVMLMLVIMFVVCDAVAEPNFASQAGFCQELQGTIDGSLPDAGVFLPGEPVKVFAGKVRFRPQEYLENQVALRGALESPLLDMFEKNFLLFSHFWAIQLRL